MTYYLPLHPPPQTDKKRGQALPIPLRAMELNQAEIRAHYDASRRGRCLAEMDLMTV